MIMPKKFTQEELDAQAERAELNFNRQGSTTQRKGEMLVQREEEGSSVVVARTSLTNAERLQQQRENDENERTR